MIQLIIYIILFTAAFALGVVLIPRVVRLAQTMHLYDHPDQRKVHQLPIPRLGGVVFLPVVLMVMPIALVFLLRTDILGDALWEGVNVNNYVAYFAGALLLLFVGLYDDLAGTTYRVKFVVQAVAAVLLCIGGLWIADFAYVFFVRDVPWWFGMPATILFVMYVTNAMNLIDGIDGLASGLSIIALAVIAILNAIVGHIVWAMLAVSMMGIVSAFFYYNVFNRRYRIFMGDCGSLTLGFTLAFLILHFWQINPVWNPAQHNIGIIAISTLVIPMMDVVRVMASRLRDGRNPFLPDKNHIHHKLMRTGLGQHAVMATLLLLSVMFIGVNWLVAEHLSQTLMIVFDILLYFIMHGIINYFIRRAEAGSRRPWSRVLCIALPMVCATAANADVTDYDIQLSAEASVTSSNGTTPLWLNANRYGMSSLKQNNGYLRVMAIRPNDTYSLRKWEWGFGADVALAYGHSSTVFLQQAYADLRYRLGYLTIGSKQQPMELRINELSSGSQTLGINAHPIPQVRLGLKDYWHIPGLNRWLAFKGHIAYGVMTDGGWQERFAKGTRNKFNKWTRHHEKAGYLRIGKEERFPLTLTIGLEMGGQFGGSVYNWTGIDQFHNTEYKVDLDSGIKSYWHALTGTGSDVGEGKYQNSEGNTLGSWVARLSWNDRDWALGVYFDHFFEDHSGMFLLDYDGYGVGDEWNVRKDNRYLGYSLSDFMLGIDLKLKKFRYINQFVAEYVNTTYQSSPIYHDHNQGISDHVGGRDNYYNHASLSGWQHWGQVIGNPLYLSPLYNTDGFIGTSCNRFRAWHFGLSGDPVNGLHYRVLLSWQRGWGTYDDPFIRPAENTSVLLEAQYRFATVARSGSFWSHISATVAWGADYGKLRNDNNGFQFSIRYDY